MPGALKNLLLRSLPRQAAERVLRRCAHVRLEVADVAAAIGEPVAHLYFPEDAVISTISSYSDGSTIEMTTVGREGCTGVDAALGARTSLVNAVTHIGGHAWKLESRAFLSLMDDVAEFKTAVHIYLQAFIYQALVSGACNGTHRLDQRLARLLLHIRDRRDEEVLMLTHEFLADMLGVQRPSVTNEARVLQSRGLVRYERGKLVILDRSRLEEASCECYRLIRGAYDSLLLGGLRGGPETPRL